MTRLSGTLANRPPPARAVGARYYAIDEQQVYFSTGTQWAPKNALEDIFAVGQMSGANLSTRPDPNKSIGYIWTDAETGNQYEAFPNAWALINDLTPAAPPEGVTPATPVWVRYNLTIATFLDSGSLDADSALGVNLPVGNASRFSPTMDVVHGAACQAAGLFTGTGSENLKIYCGYRNPADLASKGAFLSDLNGFGFGQIVTSNAPFDPAIFAISQQGGVVLGRQVAVFLWITGATAIEDYQALFGGEINLWLLQSVLPVPA